MSSHENTLYKLYWLLVTTIYPNDSKLMRNDRAAAQLVADYVEVMIETYRTALSVPWWSRTTLQTKSLEIHFVTKALRTLTPETIRKYISELWSNEAFRDHIKISIYK